MSRDIDSISRLCESVDRLSSLVADIGDSLRVIAARRTAQPKEARAIQMLVELGPDNVSAIAKAVGVHRRTLYRWPEFTEAMERLRAAAAWSKRTPRAVTRDGDLIDVA